MWHFVWVHGRWQKSKAVLVPLQRFVTKEAVSLGHRILPSFVGQRALPDCDTVLGLACSLSFYKTHRVNSHHGMNIILTFNTYLILSIMWCAFYWVKIAIFAQCLSRFLFLLIIPSSFPFFLLPFPPGRSQTHPPSILPSHPPSLPPSPSLPFLPFLSLPSLSFFPLQSLLFFILFLSPNLLSPFSLPSSSIIIYISSSGYSRFLLWIF